MDLTKMKSFHALPEPVVTRDFTILGIFPYETASVINECRMPRDVANTVYNLLPRNFQDNKIVIVCRDNVDFGTDDFAVYCKDYGCAFGSWNQVKGYAGRPLE